MLNKVVHVPAFFIPIGKEKSVKVSTGKKSTGFFGLEKEIFKKEKQWVQTGFSDCIVDGERLMEDLNNTIKSINEDGYEVVSILPITSGNYNYRTYHGGLAGDSYGYGYGYGYSYTSSMIITIKKIS